MTFTLELCNELDFVRDIINYEGPLFSVLKDKENTPYFYYWVDCDDKYNIWLLVKTSQSVIQDVIDQTLDIRTALLSPVECALVYYNTEPVKVENYLTSDVKIQDLVCSSWVYSYVCE